MSDKRRIEPPTKYIFEGVPPLTMKPFAQEFTDVKTITLDEAKSKCSKEQLDFISMMVAKIDAKIRAEHPNFDNYPDFSK